jgi:hypothetical protein
MAKKKTVAAEVVPEAVPETNQGTEIAEVIEVAPAPQTAKVDSLTFKIGIDQIGADVDGAVSDKMFFELTVTKGAEPLNIAGIAARLGRQVWSTIKHLKTKRQGFNVTFLLDNQLVANQSMKAAGTIKFTNPVNTMFGILGLLAVQFDDMNAEGFITGNFENTPEISMLCRQLGIKSGSLPWEYLESAIDLQRKKVGKDLSTKKRELLTTVSMN